MRNPRLGFITPIHVTGKRNYFGRPHWRWEVQVCWRGEVLCEVILQNRGEHATKRAAVDRAMMFLKRLGVKPEHTCLRKTENKKDADFVGTSDDPVCAECGKKLEAR